MRRALPPCRSELVGSYLGPCGDSPRAPTLSPRGVGDDEGLSPPSISRSRSPSSPRYGDYEPMLRFAVAHGVAPQVEVLPAARVNEAIQRVRDNKARYRMVLEF